MSDRVLRLSAASALVAALIFGLAPASAQSGDPKAGDKAKQSESQAKDTARKAEELSDTAKATSRPGRQSGMRLAGSLAWPICSGAQDMDTAFRHLDLYDRFGCPGGHIQATFRCLVRHGHSIDSEGAGIP